MSKEKQIDEMARSLNEATFGVNVHTLADHLHPETIHKVAEYLYNAGYRKQREVAMEIFDEIERTFKGLLNGDISNVLKLLSTLKKEYVEQKLDEAEKALEERKEK